MCETKVTSSVCGRIKCYALTQNLKLTAPRDSCNPCLFIQHLVCRYISLYSLKACNPFPPTDRPLIFNCHYTYKTYKIFCGVNKVFLGWCSPHLTFVLPLQSIHSPSTYWCTCGNGRWASVGWYILSVPVQVGINYHLMPGRHQISGDMKLHVKMRFSCTTSLISVISIEPSFCMI